MTQFVYLVGDLLDSEERVIAHGANCQGVMGAGIARQIHDRYGVVFHQYQKACRRGTFVNGSALPVDTDAQEFGSRTVFNLGTQNQTGADASYWAVFLSFANMAEQMKRWDWDRVAIPRIGCGIGGLSWEPVAKQISSAFAAAKAKITVAVYDLPVQP